MRDVPNLVYEGVQKEEAGGGSGDDGRENRANSDKSDLESQQQHPHPHNHNLLSRYYFTYQWEDFICRCKRLPKDWNRMELSGSLGDLGTLLPLLLGLAQANIIKIVPALFFAGLYNIITGFQWDIPMCVQPMKSISAVAIAGGMTAAQVSISGILTGGMVLFLGVTTLIDFIHKVIPTAVICGIQIGVGLKLLIKGAEMVTSTGNWREPDSMTTGLVVFIFMLFAINHPRFPTALVAFLIGLVIAIVLAAQSSSNVVYGVLSPVILAPSDFEWKVSDILPALTDGALPQIPLTTLNSVIAVCMLAEDLFSAGEAPTRISVAASVGTMNIVACSFGGMPMCHGSGGLAGQYKFGARTGSSVIFLGAFKIIVAIVIGSFVDPLLEFYPVSVLGVMLVFAGMELAAAGRRIENKEDAYLALLTAACVLANLTKGNTSPNTGLGAAIGLGMAFMGWFYRKCEERWWPSREESSPISIDAEVAKGGGGGDGTEMTGLS